MSFQNLKRNRSNIDKLVQRAESAGGGKKDYSDSRMWKPTVDKAGNAYAVIRFLPAKNPDDAPWVEYWDHGFQGPGGMWYIEKSLTSIDQDDPVSEYNSKLWPKNKDDKSPEAEAAREQVRKQKRRLHFVSNIYVVQDPGNPENEGKVFLYQYGKKIFDKLMDAMKPQYDDEVAIDPFNMWEGANFKVKQRKVDGWPNFDKCEFEDPAPLSEDDDKLEQIYNSMYDLNWFKDPANYKSYDELKKKLEKVLQLDEAQTESKRDAGRDRPRSEEPKSPGREAEPRQSRAPVEEEDLPGDDDNEALSYFERLAQED